MARPGILLADDHTLVLEAFKKLLEPEFDVVGTASDSHDLVSLAPKLKPDVIVLDIGMPGGGIVAGGELKKLLPRTKLIVLTMNEDAEIAREAMRLWASGYVLKKAGSSELITAIREVLRDKTYLTPGIARRLEEAFIRDPRPEHKHELTTRQREVLQLLAEGCTMREAADQLHVTTRTVAFHKYRIMEEFGLQTNSDLVRFAIREHLIPPALDL
jgi:DNA-binding NarL/FixJ family response regulator